VFRWDLLFAIFFVAVSETDAILDAALKGQNLTDRGVWVGLLIIGVFLMIWFARMQFAKEKAMTDKLAKLTEECTKATLDNTLAMQSLKMSLDVMTEDIRRIDEHQQQAAKAAEEREKHRRRAQ
jgi:hypothetical protein